VVRLMAIRLKPEERIFTARTEAAVLATLPKDTEFKELYQSLAGMLGRLEEAHGREIECATLRIDVRGPGEDEFGKLNLQIKGKRAPSRWVRFLRWLGLSLFGKTTELRRARGKVSG